MIDASMPRRPIRIANCSGFYGDRLSAMAEVLRGGDVDVITGDYLAEITMLVLAKNRLKDPSSGYAKTFLTQIDPLLEEIAEKGVKVVVNAGGLNPSGLAAAVRTLCAERQVRLNVAHVEGDDILDRLNDLQAAGHGIDHLDTGKPLSEWNHPPLTANAYLGAWGIVAALKAGADIVICPRVTDASVIVGPAAWWHDWASDDWDRLAGAVVAGHIIECGTQATGGNYSGFPEIPDLIRPGFPMAEIDAAGSCIITKHPGTGGAVTVGTVTAQLLYEIQGLDYLNPDVTVQLDTIHLEDCGTDHVRVTGTRGAPPPATTKVALTALGGFENSMMFVLTGLDRERKGKLVEDGFRSLLLGADIDELRFEHIGGLGDATGDQLGVTSFFRVSVRGAERAVGRAFFDASVELGLASYPGLFSLRTGSRAASAYGVYWPGLLPQTDLIHEAILEDGSRILALTPPATSRPREAQVEARPTLDLGATRSAALGEVFHARSGDKGGNGNVGIWAVDEAGYRWLEAMLTPEVIRNILPETTDLTVERFELPNLRAVNFVVRGLLDGGATETLRLDAQAKALGEYLRAKVMEIPIALLSSNRTRYIPSGTYLPD